MFHQLAVSLTGQLSSEPEICLSERREPRLEPPETNVCIKSTDQHTDSSWAGYVSIIMGATKMWNPLKYKTRDILKMLAAKMTLLQF